MRIDPGFERNEVTQGAIDVFALSIWMLLGGIFALIFLSPILGLLLFWYL